jgi:hypothetical protein
MAEAKTKSNDKSVDAFLGSIEGDQRQADARTFQKLMEKVTGEKARMWGDNIVGFGTYHYKYASGHEGDTCLVGFSPRKAEFSLYLTGTYFPETEQRRAELLDRLGKHRMGKACMYVKKADDIDLKVLEQLVRLSVDTLRDRYPATSS